MTNKQHENTSMIHHAEFSDIDEHITSLRCWDLHVAQLVPGTSLSNQLNLSLGEYEYHFFGHSLRSAHQATQPQQGLSFFIPLKSEAQVVYFDQYTDQPVICCAPFGQKINIITPDDFRGVTVFISYNRLQHLLDQLFDGPTAYSCLNSSSLYYPSSQQFQRLSSSLTAIHEYFSDSHIITPTQDVWIKNITEFKILPAILDIMANRQNRSIQLRPQTLMKAINILIKNVDSPPTIAELASEMGLTTRSLQYLFKEHLGMSPKSFLSVIRLNAARTQLWNTSYSRGKVTDIANRLGYWHMGDFAQNFKKIFAVTPGEILQRGKQ